MARVEQTLQEQWRHDRVLFGTGVLLALGAWPLLCWALVNWPEFGRLGGP